MQQLQWKLRIKVIELYKDEMPELRPDNFIPAVHEERLQGGVEVSEGGWQYASKRVFRM